jgi:lipopolysaccharide/colanic/teichoic acid biosynthesis glycosyltransferase
MVLLALVMPLLLVVVCLLKLDSRGPLLYRQDRVGAAWTSLTLLKIRSLRVDAEACRPWRPEHNARWRVHQRESDR